MNDYVDVASRLVEFRTKHPEGSLQPADLSKPFEVVTIGQDVFIAVTAAAYRTADDPRPGVGMAYERFPGKTPYTRDSELQNAETSAWGRAIMAALAADARKGIASQEEVRNRQAPQQQPVELGEVGAELNGRIGGIETVPDLQALWTATGEALEADTITQAEADLLAQRMKVRRDYLDTPAMAGMQ